MRLSFDLELGALRITFDPFGQLDTEPDDDEPVVQGIGAAESTHEYGDPHRGPELQHGHRDPFYDEGGRWAEQRAGFRPTPRA